MLIDCRKWKLIKILEIILELKKLLIYRKKAKLQAGIKPTTLCSVIDKENSIESLLDLLYYIYNYYCGYTSCLPQSLCPSADFFVTCCDCDSWPFCDLSHTFLWLCDCHMIFPMLYLSNNLKEKKRKRKKYKYWLSCFAKSWHLLYVGDVGKKPSFLWIGQN